MLDDRTALSEMLKYYYTVEGVQNLLERGDPRLKYFDKVITVEGKKTPFAVSDTFGFCSAAYTKVKANALSDEGAVVFNVDAGQLFTSFQISADEIQAIKSEKGGFQSIPDFKLNACIEGLSRGLAASLDGRGYGEIGVFNDAATFVANTAIDISLPSDVLIKIPTKGKILLKPAVSTAENDANVITLTIVSVNEDTVTVKPAASSTVTAGSHLIICIEGSMIGSAPRRPMGLGGWIPAVNARTGATWTNFIDDQFFGVHRSAHRHVYGNFIAAKTDTETKQTTIERAAIVARRMGLVSGVLFMNDEDYFEYVQELEAKNQYYTITNTAEGRNAAFGYEKVAGKMVGTSISEIVDSPYVVKQQFWLLDPKVVVMFEYSNSYDYATKKVKGSNEAGKALTTDLENESPVKENALIHGLNIDYLFDIHSGEPTDNGATTLVDMHFFGSWAVINPSLVTTGFFAKAKATPDGTPDFSGIVSYYA